MNESELAVRLAAVEKSVQADLLKKHFELSAVTLAENLRKLCYEAWLADPEKTKRIISALVLLGEVSKKPFVGAVAQWSLGIGEILNGQMRTAIEFFDLSEKWFLDLAQTVAAAETQVSKIYALAMLGLYDEAVECGLRVRDIFLQNGETLAAGKIEHNLGNLYQRRDRYDRAEHFLRMARARFDGETEVFRLIQSDNSLANALAHQHKFREAEQIYTEAIEKARTAKLEVTQAEIESNLGHLLLFQGRFDRALYYFESSRRRYVQMQLPHQSAIAEQELADTYLELNLAHESAAIYERVEKVFAELELNAERSRSLAGLARSRILLGETEKAHDALAESQKIFAAERNFIGEATVKLIEAKLFYSEKNYRQALEKAESAEPVFEKAQFLGRMLAARALRGETLRLLSENFTARALLRSALGESERAFIPQIALFCHTSLGLLEALEKNIDEAENHFRQAILIVEEMRAPLAAEDFRTAFLADNLTPYHALIQLYLDKSGAENIKKAFLLAEKARSRVLLEMLGAGVSKTDNVPSDTRLTALRDELNWLYNRLNRSPLENNFDADKSVKIQDEIRQRENEILELNRQQKIFSEANSFVRAETLDLEKLQKNLGPETALVEFLTIDGKLSAFVVTDKNVEFAADLGDEQMAAKNLENLSFQLDAMKTQNLRGRASHYDLTTRTRTYLSALYRQLLQPLEDLTALRRLVIVPHGVLHYVPFHALFDGFGYVVETNEISYAPSAGILNLCLEKRKTVFDQAVLVGVEDEFTPQISSEIEMLAQIFPTAQVLINQTATLANLKQNSPAADVLHLACHGQFRPDNPLFSALKLYDGWFNVRDAYTLRLDANLVVLSACETGLNLVAAGDELLGLTRGFLSAGAASMILSLWQVDDATTAELMRLFYEQLRFGLTPAKALRFAQVQMMEKHPHPFFWAPFILVGGF